MRGEKGPSADDYLHRRIDERVLGSLPAGGDVFDFGAGTAPLRARIAGSGRRYVAGDIDGQPDVRIVEGQPLPVASESFDAVLSMQVLEHVWDVDWYLRETSRVLRPGGTLVLSTHGVWPYHPHPADYRRWTRVGLLRELESRGFAVEGCDAILAPPAWIAQFGFLAVQRFLLGPAWLRPFRWAHAVLGSFVVRCIETLSPAGLRANDAAVYVVSARKRGML